MNFFRLISILILLLSVNQYRIPGTIRCCNETLLLGDSAYRVSASWLPTQNCFGSVENRLFEQGNVRVWVMVFVAEPCKAIICTSVGRPKTVSRAIFGVKSDSEIKQFLTQLFSTHRSAFSTYDRFFHS